MRKDALKFQFPTNGNVSLDYHYSCVDIEKANKFQFPTNGNVSLDFLFKYFKSHGKEVKVSIPYERERIFRPAR